MKPKPIVVAALVVIAAGVSYGGDLAARRLARHPAVAAVANCPARVGQAQENLVRVLGLATRALVRMGGA